MRRAFAIVLLLLPWVEGCSRRSIDQPLDAGPAPSDLSPAPDLGDSDGGKPAPACSGPSQCGLALSTVTDRCDWRVGNAVFDVDGDGRPDWLQRCDSGLFARRTVVAADGRVSFELPHLFDVGAMADGQPATVQDVADGDLDGDGENELVVRAADHLAVFTRTVAGLALAQLYPLPDELVVTSVGEGLAHVLVGDIDGDGLADVVLDDPISGDITIARTLAGGTLGALTSQPLTVKQPHLRLVDLDGDLRADLVVSDWYGQAALIARGQSDGHFGDPTPLASAIGATDSVAGDFDEDGRLDLILSHQDWHGNALSYRLTTETTSGAAAGDYIEATMPAWCGALWRGDFNGDGHLDVLTTGALGSGLVLYDGNGKGALAPWNAQPGGGYLPTSKGWLGAYQPVMGPPVVADFNGDGLDDLIVESMQGPYAVWYGSRVSAPLQIDARQPDGDGDSWYRVGDVDGDGLPDVVSGAGLGDPVWLRRGLGQGRLGPPGLRAPAADVGALADFDGQPGDELITVGGGGPALWSGLAGVARPLPNLATQGYGDVQVARLAGDVHAGLLLSSATTIDLARGRGDGTFADPLPLQALAQTRPMRLETGDFDCDGRGDIAALLVPTSGPGITTLRVQFDDGHGGFTAPLVVTADDLIYDVVAGDFDGDGCADLAVGQKSYVRMLRGQASRGFVAGAALLGDGYAPTSMVHGLRAADFDGDGTLDLVTVSSVDGVAWLWLGRGDATFATWSKYATDNSTVSYELADVDGDGRPDLFALTGYGHWILRNTFPPR